MIIMPCSSELPLLNDTPGHAAMINCWPSPGRTGTTCRVTQSHQWWSCWFLVIKPINFYHQLASWLVINLYNQQKLPSGKLTWRLRITCFNRWTAIKKPGFATQPVANWPTSCHHDPTSLDGYDHGWHHHGGGHTRPHPTELSVDKMPAVRHECRQLVPR